MKRRKVIPRWKRIILTQQDWPAWLRLPLEHDCPPGSEGVHIGSDRRNSWNWDLFRDRFGKVYYLKAWRVGCHDPPAKAVRLTPDEALQFAIIQCINPQLLKDAKP